MPTSSSVRTPRKMDELAAQLFAEFKKAIPSNEVIIRQALENALKSCRDDRNEIKKRISRVLSNAEAQAHEQYLGAQQRAVAIALRKTFRPLVTHLVSGTQALELLARSNKSLDAFFLKIAQGRKARAGRAMEAFFGTLFQMLGYPFERAKLADGTPDFVFPSAAHFRKLPTDCIVFTTKRTLRERWRQITSEGSHGTHFFLGTLEEKISSSALDQIKAQKIYLVVPEHVRAEKYAATPHVLSVEDFLENYLDLYMKRWKEKGVVKSRA
jgi:restriction endonuclease EcoRII-like protein